MSFVEYNFWNILGHLIVFFGFFVFLFFILKETKKLGWAKHNFGLVKYGMITIICIFSSLVLIDTFLSTAPTEEKTITIEVTDTIFSGGFGGFWIFRSATIFGVDEDGNENAYSISLFCSKEFKKKVLEITEGEEITLLLSMNGTYFYDFSIS